MSKENKFHEKTRNVDEAYIFAQCSFRTNERKALKGFGCEIFLKISLLHKSILFVFIIYVKTRVCACVPVHVCAHV